MGEDGVAHGVGDVPHARQHLGDEEGVPPRLTVELGGVDVVGRGEFGDAGGGQRCKRETIDAHLADQLAEHDAHRVVPVEPVVAVAGQHEGRDRSGAPREQPQHVKRCLVGPMDVLEDHHAGTAKLQFGDQCHHDVVWLGARGQQFAEIAADARGDVEQRPERSRREQCVARPP